MIELQPLQEDIERFHRASAWLEEQIANGPVQDTSDGVIAEHMDRMREALHRQMKQLNSLRLLVLASQQMPLWAREETAMEARRDEWERAKMRSVAPGWEYR